MPGDEVIAVASLWMKKNIATRLQGPYQKKNSAGVCNQKQIPVLFYVARPEL